MCAARVCSHPKEATPNKRQSDALGWLQVGLCPPRQAFLLRYPLRAADAEGDGIMPSLGSDDGPPPFTLAGKLAHGVWLYKSANRDRTMSLGRVREWFACAK